MAHRMSLDEFAAAYESAQAQPIVIIDRSSEIEETLPDGRRVPGEFRVLILDPRTQLWLDMEIYISRGGTVNLYRLRLEPIDDDPVTPSRLHDLRLGLILDQVVASVAMTFDLVRRGRYQAKADDAGLALVRELKRVAPTKLVGRLVVDEEPARRRGRPVSDEELRRVAEIVEANDYDPRKEVMRTLHVSGRTASRWIAAAKDRGFVGAAKKGDGK